MEMLQFMRILCSYRKHKYVAPHNVIVALLQCAAKLNCCYFRWKGAEKYLKDYNDLGGGSAPKHIEAIDGTESSISGQGCQHFGQSLRLGVKN